MYKLKLLEKALQIASLAHFGQVDKQGVPYIFHPLRVMHGCNTVDEQIVGILHDTVEDTEITGENLLQNGFPQYIVDAILAMSKSENEDYDNYLTRVMANEIAREVKLQDLKDNLDTSRLDSVSMQDMDRMNKYISALARLQGNDL